MIQYGAVRVGLDFIGNGGRADWAYRPVVVQKWTRWGFWDEDGIEFTPTRVL